MKEYLEKLIAKKRDEFKKAQERSNASNDLAEVRSIGEMLNNLRSEIADAEAQLAAINERAEDHTAEGRMIGLGLREQRQEVTEDRAATAEYRSAYLKKLMAHFRPQ